jgi:hypothetical protein
MIGLDKKHFNYIFRGISMKQESHFEIAIASISCFTDDGTLDLGELNFLLGLAMRDGVVDENEKRVLGSIFSKVTSSDVSGVVWDRIQAIKKEHGI